MAEGKQAGMPILGWRLTVLCVIAMVAAIGLALLLIPPLSLNAAVRGGTTAISVFLFTQLALRLYARYWQRNGRD